jgi:hypothetical protein
MSGISAGEERPEMQSHFLHMLLYSFLVAIFFGVLLRREIREQARLTAYILLGMVGGGVILTYIMFPFPG